MPASCSRAPYTTLVRLSVVAGTGLTGGGSSPNVTVNLTNSGVTANPYGSATQVATFTVDAQGRLTAAASATIALPTTQINQQGASTNQELQWNGAAWFP